MLKDLLFILNSSAWNMPHSTDGQVFYILIFSIIVFFIMIYILTAVIRLEKKLKDNTEAINEDPKKPI